MNLHLPGTRQITRNDTAYSRTRATLARSTGRKRSIASLLLALSAVALLSAGTAVALPPLEAAAPTEASILANSSNVITGAALSGGDPDGTLRVSVATDKGTISIDTVPVGLTLAEGFDSWTDRSEIAFTGTRADANTALASLSINPGDNGGDSAHVTVNAEGFVSGLVYSPTNGHYYEFVPAAQISWPDARVDAATRTFGGQTGYLATIPSVAINDLIAERIPGALNAWFGAQGYNEDFDWEASVKRRWFWADGPLANTSILECWNYEGPCEQINGPWPLAGTWAPGEPNNSGGETGAVTNWLGSVGHWNDLQPYDSAGVSGYIVEYGDLAEGSSTPFSEVASASVSLPIADVSTPPASPTASMQPGSQTATIEWEPPVNSDAIPEVSGYTVSSFPAAGTCSAAANESSCTIGGLDWGTGYTFSVTAENSLGSSDASELTNSVTALTAPGDVTDVEATSVGSTATINWTPPTFTGGSALTSYSVNSYPFGGSCTAVAPVTTCDISGLTLGTAYYFFVTATNSNVDPHGHTSPGGESAVSPTITPALVPDAPEDVEATTFHDSVDVSWTVPPFDGGLPIESYEVVAQPGGATCTAVAPLTSCTINGLEYGTEYTFEVTATNAIGESDPGGTSAGVTPEILPPGPPTNVGATANSKTSASISWTPPLDDGGAAVTYTVTTEPGGLSCATDGTSCEIGGLEPGKSYVFVVRATNVAGSADGSVARSPELSMANPLIATATLARSRIMPRNARGKLITRMFTPRRGSNAQHRERLKVRGGTRLVVSTNKPGTLKVTIYAKSAKAGASKRWVKTSGQQPSIRVKQGASYWRFSARTGVTSMKPGDYRMTFDLTDAEGGTAILAPIEFTVLRRKIR